MPILTSLCRIEPVGESTKIVPKLRYRDYAQKCKPLLQCTKSLKRDDIEIFDLLVEDEHKG